MFIFDANTHQVQAHQSNTLSRQPLPQQHNKTSNMYTPRMHADNKNILITQDADADAQCYLIVAALHTGRLWADHVQHC